MTARSMRAPPSPDGSLVATAGGTRHAIQIWDPLNGERKHVLQGVGEPVTAVGIDAAGSAIAWGVANPCPERVSCPEVMGDLTMKLDLPTADRFFENPAPLDRGADGFRRAVLAANGWTLAAKPGGKDGLDNAMLEIASDGKPVQTIENDATNGYLHAAFTLIGDGSRLITGGNDGTLIEYDTATGKIAGEFRGGHTGEINSIAIAEKAGLMVTGSADQTIRLWNLKTRELIVSMFFAGKEFVIWMPQGYYYSSDDGDKLIGWHVNQGRDKEGRFIRAGQLKKYLWSPEMVRRAIILKSASQAVQEMRPGVDHELERLLERKPPEFGVKLADDQKGVRDGFVAVEISGADEAGTDVSDFSILSNSRNVGDFASRSISGDGKTAVIQVPVDDGENQITITGVNEYGYLTERSVVAIAKKTDKGAKKGKLYVVVVGADKYPFLKTDCSGRPCDLRYPVDDAAEFLRVLSEKSAPLYTGLEALVLVNRESLDETPELEDAITKITGIDAVLEPESDNIADQIADFLDKPTADDTTIVFVAGHGINIDEDYYFIPSDGRKSDPDKWKRSSLVEWDDIQKAVERAEGVRFMLLDTCHAANAFNPRLEKDAADARIVVFSATAANSTAAELPELGHGVFTYSVLEGLRGAADTGGDGVQAARSCRLHLPRGDQAHQRAAEAVLLHQQHGKHPACATVSRPAPCRVFADPCGTGCLPSPCLPFFASIPHALAAAACPPGDADYPLFYDSADLFDRAIDKVRDYPPSNVRLTGITVPHHLLADRLVALGFKAASGQSYKRIVILTPDHFRKTDKPFATTRRGFDTVKGKVATDVDAVSRLLKAGDWIEENCLFDKDHGIRAMLPFVKHYFPEAAVLPVAISIQRRPRRLGQDGRCAGTAGRRRHADRRIDRLLALSAAARGAPLRPADAEHPGLRFARRHRRAAAAAACRFGRRALYPDEAAEAAVLGRAAGHRQREFAALFA